MRMIPGMSGAEIGLRIWRKVRAERGTPAHAWFVRRFTVAATVVIDRWGPSWARRRVGDGGSLGGWALLVLWLGLSAWITTWVW
jgi:hypothetical protein